MRSQPFANRHCCGLRVHICSLPDFEQCRIPQEQPPPPAPPHSSLQPAAHTGAYEVLSEFERVLLSHSLELLKGCVKKKKCIDTFIFSLLSKGNMVDISGEIAFSFPHLLH